MHTPGVQFLKMCTLHQKYARLVQGAPLISNTAVIYQHLELIRQLSCINQGLEHTGSTAYRFDGSCAMGAAIVPQ